MACLHQQNNLQYLLNNFSHLLDDEKYIRNKICHISQYKKDDLIFGKITSKKERDELGVFRLNNYWKKKPYMLNELDQQGFDSYDDQGSIYAAWLNNEMIASIRLCYSPFESNHFLSDTALKNFLGDHYQNEYLEWTRLLIRPNHHIPGLLRALIIYAGIKTLQERHYHKYFGYSTPIVKRLFSRFQLSHQLLEFKIPKRGNQIYTLLKGDFAVDFLNLLKME